MRKLHPKTGLQHVHLLHDNAQAHKSSTVAQFLKSENVNVLSHLPYSPDLTPCDFSLSGRRFRSRSVLGSAVYQFLMGVLKDEYKNCLKIGN